MFHCMMLSTAAQQRFSHTAFSMSGGPHRNIVRSDLFCCTIAVVAIRRARWEHTKVTDKDWLWIGCLLPVVWLAFVLVILDLPYTKYSWHKLAAWPIWPAVQLHSIWSPHMKSGWENVESKIKGKPNHPKKCVPDLKAQVWEWNDRARHLPNRLIWGHWGSEVHAF